MNELAAEDLFKLADQAKEEQNRDTGDDVLSDDADAHSVFTNPVRKIRTGKPTFTEDIHGDIHVCFGTQCSFASLDRENNWVCAASGRVVGVECSREQDPSWTGRSTGSANPDDSAGTPIGGWIKRRDMYAASVAAYRSAHSISDAEIAPPPLKLTNATTTPAVKRGALCVDEVVVETSAKRPRSSRKENWTRECIEKLANEAVGVIDKLFIVNLDAEISPTTTDPPIPVKLDPRMQNMEFVRPLALKSYVEACKRGQQSLNLDSLTTVLIHTNEFVRNQRTLAAKQLKAASAIAIASTTTTTTTTTATTHGSLTKPTKNVKSTKTNKACFSGQVRNLLSQLIVSLWRASCLTNHFKMAKKGNDSFRPFAAGILYSLKRGLYLPDGTCAVPVLSELSDHLPALRSASSTPAAKQLQSSSHRGICSIQRSLASIADMSKEDAKPALALLKDAARQGAFLREMVSRSV